MNIKSTCYFIKPLILSIILFNYFIFRFFIFILCHSTDDKYETDDYIETITGDGESVDKMQSSNSMGQQIVCINTDGSEYQSHQIEVDEYNEDALEEDALETTQYERTIVSSNAKGSKNDNSSYYINVLSNSSGNNDTQIQSSRQSKHIAQTQHVSMHNDPDERFLLSCLPILKRLPNKKNALARLKIQQLLFEIEFDEYSEMNSQ